MQRVILDFTSDHSFGKSAVKLEEHYGYTLHPSRLRTLTLEHGKACADKTFPQAPETAARQIISEMDGTMTPMVETGKGKDARKERRLYWREARLSLAYQSGQTTMVYGAVLGDRFEAGVVWEQTAVAAGYGSGETSVHGVGDGACWITEEFDGIFGTDGSYLLDFYHVGEYLSEASKACAPDQSEKWLDVQKGYLLEGKQRQVLSELKEHCEETTLTGTDKPPVNRASDYLEARAEQLDYQGAREAKLPIGSGAIEGNHRSVIHERLKISGAWWLPENAGYMLNLRTLRANGCWANYWASLNCPPLLVTPGVDCLEGFEAHVVCRHVVVAFF